MTEFMQQGGPVMWPLLVLSFISVTFIVERGCFYVLEASRRQPKQLQDIFDNAEEGQFNESEAVANKSKNDFVIRTLLSGLEHREHSVTQALETQGMAEIRRMRKRLPILNTIITAAPLMGILGTVLGIIQSFDVLGSKGVTDPLGVTTGISQALITTAFGLIIALVTLLPYNYYQTLCQHAIEELEKYSSVLELIIQKAAKQTV